MCLADQFKTWYGVESYGAFKQVDTRSVADKRALSILKFEIFHDSERNIVLLLWSDNEVNLPNSYYSSLAQLKSLERRFDKYPSLCEKYAEKITDDMQNGYIITVKAMIMSGILRIIRS